MQLQKKPYNNYQYTKHIKKHEEYKCVLQEQHFVINSELWYSRIKLYSHLQRSLCIIVKICWFDVSEPFPPSLSISNFKHKLALTQRQITFSNRAPPISFYSVVLTSKWHNTERWHTEISFQKHLNAKTEVIRILFYSEISQSILNVT